MSIAMKLLSHRKKLLRVIVVVSVLGTIPSRALAGEPTIRVATYNTSLFRDKDGELIRDLDSSGNEQARKIAEVIQRPEFLTAPGAYASGSPKKSLHEPEFAA